MIGSKIILLINGCEWLQIILINNYKWLQMVSNKKAGIK